MTSCLQVLLELKRDCTCLLTYDGARAIVEAHGGGYGIGLAYARDMIHRVERMIRVQCPWKCATLRVPNPRLVSHIVQQNGWDTDSSEWFKAGDTADLSSCPEQLWRQRWLRILTVL